MLIPAQSPLRRLVGICLIAACGSSPSATEPGGSAVDATPSDTPDQGGSDVETRPDADDADADAATDDVASTDATPDTTDAAALGPARPVYRQRLASRDPVPLRFFGKALDLDARLLVVGATGSDEGVDGAGRVTLFEEVAGRWELRDVVFPVRNDSRPYFGRALALLGDTLWVGSHGEDGEGFGDDAGAVDRFDVRAMPPTPDAPPLRGSAGSHLGLSVDASERWLCVGAPRAGDTEQGRAYMLRTDDLTNAVAEAHGTEPGAWLGMSAAAVSDGCVFGADGTRDGVRQAGAVVRCTVEGCAPLLPPDADGRPRPPIEGARFGASVAGGNGLLAVGAPGTATTVGQVAVGDLSADPITWAWLTSPQTNDAFGAAVAFAGDRLLVGAPLGDGAEVGARDGVVYVYERQGGAWTLTESVRSPREQGGAEFGHAVAGDARWLVATARFDDGDVDRSGAAYVFEWTAVP
jgi:hypothetical protein